MDFVEARRNMVDGQVRTFDVTEPRILAAMLAVPRERFVPTCKQALAYADCDLAIVDPTSTRQPRWLLKPMVLARLLQAAEVADDNRVLDVGCASGYSSALLGKLSRQVVALEEDLE